MWSGRRQGKDKILKEEVGGCEMGLKDKCMNARPDPRSVLHQLEIPLDGDCTPNRTLLHV